MKSSIVILFLSYGILIRLSAQQTNVMIIPKMTAINPVAYTDVIYGGSKDTAFLCTYSGRIARVVNGQKKEKIIASLGNEIYSLAYLKTSKELIASSFENGIFIISELTGKIIRKLSVPSSWANNAFLTKNNSLLVAQDQKGKSYIWKADKNFESLILPDSFPKGVIVSVSSDDLVTIVGRENIFLFNLKTGVVQKEMPIVAGTFADKDEDNNYLLIRYNECVMYNALKEQIVLSVKHPNWPLPNVEDTTEVYDIPLQMQLTSARCSSNEIFTASIDRTVRVWDKQTGKLLHTLTGFKGTVDKIRISKDQTQLLAIDLKGSVRFWTIEK